MLLEKGNDSNKAALIIAALLIAFTSLTLALKCNIPPTYAEFIVGDLIWSAQTKFQDLIALPVFLCMGLTTLYFLSNLATRLNQEKASAFKRQLLLWSLPAILHIGTLFLGAKLETLPFVFSTIGIGCISLISYGNVRAKTPFDIDEIGLLIFSGFLLALSPIAITLTIGRVSEALTLQFPLRSGLIAAYIFMGVFSIGLSLFSLKKPEKIPRTLAAILLVSQILISALILSIYPARLLTPEGVLIKYTTTGAFQALIVIFILSAIFDIARRYRCFYLKSYDYKKLLSPLAVFALLAAIKLGVTVPPYITPDDYHFGEGLLGWWSYLHGAIPYIDHISPHGFIPDDFPGFIDTIFYDGKARSLVDSERLSIAILGLIAYLSLYAFSNSLLLAAIAVMPLLFIRWGGASATLLFLIPFICLWFNRPLVKMSYKWMVLWVVTAPIAILGTPAQALLMVACTGIIALYNAFQILKLETKKKIVGLVVYIAALALIACSTPIAAMLFGATRYVLENVPLNQIVWGTPWYHSWNGTLNGQAFILELIRCSWIAIPIVAIFTIYHLRMTEKRNTYWPDILCALAIMTFSCLMIPYTMGRIDPNGVSRMGLTALFGWSTLIAVICWEHLDKNQKTWLLLVMVFMSNTINTSIISFNQLGVIVNSKINIYPLKNTSALENLGVVHVEDNQLARLLRLNTILNASLTEDQQFLNLSEKQATYFYLNRIPPIATTAPYNMISIPEQQRAVRQLYKNIPPIALLDCYGLSLRNPLLFRFALSNYFPSMEDGFIIGRRKDSPLADTHSAVSDRIALFEQAFGVPDLQMVPSVWGRSVKSLEKSMRLIRTLDAPDVTITHTDTVFNFALGAEGIDPTKAGMLKFHLRCTAKKADPVIQIAWQESGTHSRRSISFTAYNDVLIVPLDAYVAWVLSHPIDKIELSLENPGACATMQVDQIALFQRKSLDSTEVS